MVHPMGEENFSDFTFETYCGKVVVESTDEAMTPFGGLVPWAAFQKNPASSTTSLTLPR